MKTLKLTWGLLFAATIFAASSVLATTVFTNNTSIGVANTSYDGTDIVISNCTVTVYGAHSFNSVLVAAGGVLTHPFYPDGTGEPGLYLTVTNDVTVAGGASINASGIGYGPGSGTGSGSSASSGYIYYDGSGGGHGGNGGISSSNAAGGICYGSVYQPGTLGSGGGASYAGNGGSGGGIIQITAGGNLNIYGAISANGANATNSRAGGGAGGSIWLTAMNVNGTGSITANGGAGEAGHGGGGGGGHISIQFVTNNFSGNITACGGAGSEFGGAGTIFTQGNGQTGLLVVDNGGNVGTNSTVELPTPADVVVRGGGGVIPNGTFSPNNLTIAANSTLTTTPLTALNLTIASNLTVHAGGTLVLDSLGNAAGTGLAPGGYYSNTGYPAGGGGHGGYGGAASVTNGYGGATYDSQISPASLGSGGGNNQTSIGGAGGGAVQLNVAGTAQVDGIITANGGNGSGTGGGGGSGGSIYLNCATFSGAGTLTAEGGSGANSTGGGGGGGRIAVISLTNLFGGVLSASGGAGAHYGGAGTVYLSAPGGGPSQLILDNAGHLGANTLFQSASSANLIVQNGASALASGSVTFASLQVGSNAWLTTSPNSSEMITITGNATLQAGGGFMADSAGAGGNQGSAPGGVSSINPYDGGGGGHGGAGGNSFSNTATGGNTAPDSVTTPSNAYSGGGGGGYTGYSFGGSAGGYVRVTVGGTLQLNGLISANGGNGSGVGGGGGAGGGIYLTSGTFTGSGSISANGGTGASGLGGGGGGGMIAVYSSRSSFTGSISAYGGGGANWGGAGTIYLSTNSTGRAQLILDNGGHIGGASAGAASVDLTLQNGSRTYLSGISPGNFGNLVIGSNAWLIVSNQIPQYDLITAVNVTVQQGGFISADSGGYFPGNGNGHGNYYGSQPYYQCSGAGHAGYGANAYSNVTTGGLTYDSSSSPGMAGSGGGSDAPYSIGGNGGGVVQMNLSGNLQVDGTLSANGGSGNGTGGGGGSGGSLKINCKGFSGAGMIAANGGTGANSYGGGGGGGMIAVTFTTNSFAGSISAYGGGGASYGGAGTIYLMTNTTDQALFIVDNGGHRGTNTVVAQSEPLYNLVLRNGAVAVQSYSSQNYASLWIGSNALLVIGNYNNQFIDYINGNATIQAGGGIVGDGAGNTQNNGLGHGSASIASPWYQCSGAGYGGFGGAALSNAVAGGGTYGSTALAGYTSSGGGGIPPYSIGGSGGGSVNLSVNGSLQLDGSISVNGNNGSGGGGGGSGGTVYLNVGSLAGAGAISANGGSGGNLIGGGGGGGRIAIHNTVKTNSFTGTVSAYGGAGANYGGAGTIYYSAFGTNYAQLILDNDNNAGTNTTFDPNFMDVTIQNGAVGALPYGGLSVDNLTIHTNSTLTAQFSFNYHIQAKNITIDDGGTLQVDGAGYGSQYGIGAGYSNPSGPGGVSGGASHGGFGGGNPPSNNIAYDSIQYPTVPGSGGGNYPGVPTNSNWGGGSLTLSASGALTVNGRLSANGNSGIYNTGGGSGGSLNLNFINLLAGNGVISANGGSATGSAGGGGGGRIAIVCNSDIFSGQLSVFGGNGEFPGGAGTIYTGVAGTQTLLVNNGGLAGANTPLGSSNSLPSSPFNLNISGSATVGVVSELPLLSNFNLASGSTLTAQSGPTNLTLAVQNNADIVGNVIMDTFGNVQANGPGAGSSIGSNGSGGGYGGSGGSSSGGAPGGLTYGSATEPVDLGSGGGLGLNTATGGSEGGGALRISVGGTLNIDGNVSADGDYGWQDNSGGGSGGSVWITANALSGAGTISAQGGAGAPAGGGGGGGGRIAIYAPANSFTGTTNANGGEGFLSGQPGTIFPSSILPAFLADSQSPTGLVNNTVSTVDVFFNEAVNPASVSAAAFTLTTPTGVIPTSSLGITFPGANDVEVSFPIQNMLGNYSIQVSATITNILGVPLTQAYTGNFTISLPTVSGTVTDTNNAPVAGVTLQPGGGLPATMTDINGDYSIGVPPGWIGTITPSFGTLMFVPGSMTYSNVTASITNQNYLVVPTIAATLAGSMSGTNLSLTWPGMSGVTYQVSSSTNLVDWTPYGNTVAGTNGTQQVFLPVNTSPEMYFRIGASD